MRLRTRPPHGNAPVSFCRDIDAEGEGRRRRGVRDGGGEKVVPELHSPEEVAIIGMGKVIFPSVSPESLWFISLTRGAHFF